MSNYLKMNSTPLLNLYIVKAKKEAIKSSLIVDKKTKAISNYFYLEIFGTPKYFLP